MPVSLYLRRWTSRNACLPIPENVDRIPQLSHPQVPRYQLFHSLALYSAFKTVNLFDVSRGLRLRITRDADKNINPIQQSVGHI
jgi:hypothetical protein